MRRNKNSSWLLSVAARSKSELLINVLRPEDAPLMPADETVGWKAEEEEEEEEEDTWPAPPSRESLMQRNFNDSAAAVGRADADFSTWDAMEAFGWILFNVAAESGKSPDNHGVRYPAISAWDMDRYFSVSAARCSATSEGGGRGSLNPWIRRFLAAAAAGAKQLSETERFVRSTLRYLVDSWLKSIGESGAAGAGAGAGGGGSGGGNDDNDGNGGEPSAGPRRIVTQDSWRFSFFSLFIIGQYRYKFLF